MSKFSIIVPTLNSNTVNKLVNSIKSRNEWREVAEEYHEGKEK